MAKSKPSGQNTRAARRAATPEDKSLASLPRAESPEAPRTSLLAERANVGVQKKKKPNSKVSRAQRLRQQKGMERAEAVFDQLEIKKSKSLDRAKTIKTRRAEWEDTNRNASAFAALQQQHGQDDDDEEEDGDDDAMAEDKPQQKPKVNPFAAPAEPATADPAPVDDDDEIL